MAKKITDDQKRIYFDCSKCAAYCCSVYERVAVTNRDLKRLAKYFGVTEEVAGKRYTKMKSGERVLRHTEDVIFETACMFLDRETRGCSVYHARPNVCREYPGRPRCAYYDLLSFERQQQGDVNALPLVQITFRKVEKKIVSDDDGNEIVWEWHPSAR